MIHAIGIILMIIWTIAILILYHTVFEVVYFDLPGGCATEIIFSVLLGCVMAGLTLYLWWLTAGIIIVVGVVNAKKTSNQAHIAIAVVLAIVVAIIGIVFRLNMGSDSDYDYSYILHSTQIAVISDFDDYNSYNV